jgi:dCTP deaminase
MLSSSEILEYMRSGEIVIHPFNPANLGTNSYDVTLGKWYYREKQPTNIDAFNIYDPYLKGDVDHVWGKPFYGGTVMLAPGENILAHTNEFIGGSVNITSDMRARSSMGRSFLTVCRCAGSGDVGYFNRWTMEITNNSRYYHIPLVVGRRIAQIRFEKVGATFDYAEKGKYQAESDLAAVIKNWKPEMMLPKLYLDREVS